MLLWLEALGLVLFANYCFQGQARMRFSYLSGDAYTLVMGDLE